MEFRHLFSISKKNVKLISSTIDFITNFCLLQKQKKKDFLIKNMENLEIYIILTAAQKKLKYHANWYPLSVLCWVRKRVRHFRVAIPAQHETQIQFVVGK